MVKTCECVFPKEEDMASVDFSQIVQGERTLQGGEPFVSAPCLSRALSRIKYRADMLDEFFGGTVDFLLGFTLFPYLPLRRVQ